MVKDTGDPLVEHGTPITVMSEPFQPKRPNGSAKISFIIDTTNLDGKELVAFETCYRLNEYSKGDDVTKADKTVVAEHKDLKDEGQTVKVSKEAKRVPPKTGDNNMLWLYGGLFATAMGSMLVLVIREYIKKRRQAKEDAEMLV
ncbi:MAG: VaFE repeat-containing surface-anchored protein [Mogibacterium sp.]|nr:VaFE repeat-containing surface-anchored protein [Mogibacterium sp.]